MNENCPFDVSPYTQSNAIKTPNIFNLNYTNQDFWSMKTRLIDYIRQNFPNDFTDFVESSLGLMLIENWAFIADTLSFKMDQIANEVFIDTVTEIDNAFRLAKLVGFEPQPPIAASSLWTASLNNPVLTDLVIPAPFDISINAGDTRIYVELYPADANNVPIFDRDIIIPAGATANASIIGLEGRTKTRETISSGTISQNLVLIDSPVIYDSVRVFVDGVEWERVDYFTDSQPRREYRVEFDSSYQAFVLFGNNRAGMIPSQGSLIRAVYRQGGGSVGNLVSNTVTKQTIINTAGVEYPVPVTFSNYTRGSNGYDGDTIEDIRYKLPKWIRVQNRAVTGLDYKTLADQFVTPYHGQIGKSNAVLRNYGCSGNIVDLYVLALDGADKLKVASEELKVDLNQRIEDLKMITDYICIKNGEIINLDVSIDIIMNRFYRKFENEIRIKVENRINKFFSLNNWEYDQNVKDTDIIKSINDIKEIIRVEVMLSTDDPNNSGSYVVTNYKQIIRPDIINIEFNYE
jgi:hypothetical protein